MPCRSSVTVTTSDHFQFQCSGKCSPTGTCHVQLTHLPGGGTRAWCGCGPEEPKDCHIVVFRPNPNTPPEVICAGACATGQKCTLKRTVTGNNVVLTCACAKG